SGASFFAVCAPPVASFLSNARAAAGGAVSFHARSRRVIGRLVVQWRLLHALDRLRHDHPRRLRPDDHIRNPVDLLPPFSSPTTPSVIRLTSCRRSQATEPTSSRP